MYPPSDAEVLMPRLTFIVVCVAGVHTQEVVANFSNHLLLLLLVPVHAHDILKLAYVILMYFLLTRECFHFCQNILQTELAVFH